MVKIWYTGIVALLVAVATSGVSAGRSLCDDDSAPTPAPTRPGPAPEKRRAVVIGHRGAPGYLPDHTLEGYTLAIEHGADFIEPDLVSTKDGVLIVRHEPNLIETTDVSSRPEFADRKKVLDVDGFPMFGFFASDFTLAEIKTLRAIQPMSDRDQSYNGKFSVATFDEVIALAQAKTKELGRPIGIYPETKHPTMHRKLGLPLEEKLIAALTQAGWNSPDAPVIIQSFESENLKALRKQTRVKLAQLVNGGSVDYKTGQIRGDLRPYDWVQAGRNGSYPDMVTPEGLREIATYADIVAPFKGYLARTVALKLHADGNYPVDANGDGRVDDSDYRIVPNPQLFADAHAVGLKVHTWTFRNEAYRLASDYKGDPEQEYLKFFELGIDGVFSDYAKTAVAARTKFLS
ncbi:hypothetical protein P43SY_005399 [Pythium insidiosum]|uniref:glycerophosphodiester phosphodiesterase n=1 Tax=Pythium insidiosum TaxID=114742 RepID=A0AAD5LFK3_PYTIN|nr:hypothetical protein P43SY_005399 [Pythium insidiosum]